MEYKSEDFCAVLDSGSDRPLDFRLPGHGHILRSVSLVAFFTMHNVQFVPSPPKGWKAPRTWHFSHTLITRLLLMLIILICLIISFGQFIGYV